MITFELSFPHRGSWNNQWSGDKYRHIRVREERSVPKEIWDKDFYYRWDDGWEACVEVRRCPAADARKLEKQSAGFAGYDWMIRSLITHGDIRPEE